MFTAASDLQWRKNRSLTRSNAINRDRPIHTLYYRDYKNATFFVCNAAKSRVVRGYFYRFKIG